MENAIVIKDVTKRYKIYKKATGRMLDIFRKKPHYKPFKAISHVSVEIPKGEVVGILGKNGSGKSTLMKMVAGVTQPTSGTIETQGRISAMLELTAGFDPEFTGLENIYLKALSIGIPRELIDAKMQEILDFADIGDYIYQPVRTYSSGMRARLGFAVSVNIDPDILVVDEVLAVGDDVFKFKCMEKMREFREQGKTILFVSHSLFLIKAFCTLGMWLNQGQLEMFGEIGEVTKRYETFLKQERSKLKPLEEQGANLGFKMQNKKDILEVANFRMLNKKGKQVKTFGYNASIFVEFDYTVHKPIEQLVFCYTIHDVEGVEIYMSDKRSEAHIVNSEPGAHHLRIELLKPNLLDGQYLFSGELWNNQAGFYVTYAHRKPFAVKQKTFTGSGLMNIRCTFANDEPAAGEGEEP